MNCSSSHRPRISALLPNYNHGNYLPRALNALLAQTLPFDEILICDDGSTDNSQQVIAEFAARDSRIKPLFLAKNQGVHAAINRMLAEASGDWVFPAAADDVCEITALEKMVSALIHFPACGMVFAKTQTMNSNGTPSREIDTASLRYWPETRHFSPDQFIDDYVLRKPPFNCYSTAVLFQTEALRQAGGYQPAAKWWADGLAMELLGIQRGALFVNTLGSHYRIDVPGYSRSPRLQASEALSVARHSSAQFSTALVHNHRRKSIHSTWKMAAATFVADTAFLARYRGELWLLDQEIARIAKSLPQPARLVLTFIRRIHHAISVRLAEVIARLIRIYLKRVL